jgi:translation initiation factor 6
MDSGKCRVRGSDYTGVFCTATENLIFGPPNLTTKEYDILTRTLKTELVEVNLSGSDLIGLLCRANSNGILLSNVAFDEEIAALKKAVEGKVNVGVLHSGLNAIGSNILVNDKVAIVNEEYSEMDVKHIGDIFGVEVIRDTIAGFKTVGANNILTNSGLVLNNKANDADMKEWEKFTGFKGSTTTANTGGLAIGLCVVANSKGVVAGEATTGFELVRIVEGLEE